MNTFLPSTTTPLQEVGKGVTSLPIDLRTLLGGEGGCALRSLEAKAGGASKATAMG